MLEGGQWIGEARKKEARQDNFGQRRSRKTWWFVLHAKIGDLEEKGLINSLTKNNKDILKWKLRQLSKKHKGS